MFFKHLWLFRPKTHPNQKYSACYTRAPIITDFYYLMPAKLTLNKSDIHLWLVEPAAIKEPLLLAYYRQLLTSEENERVQRYRFEKHRHDSLVTRAFVRDLLSHYSDRPPQDWRFAKGEKDKPEIIDPPLPLRFNLSHTDGLIICAVTLDHDIGADVEHIERNSDILNIANRYFSPIEVKELFSLPDEESKRSRFFDYWTLKESYIKAWGLGLAIPLEHFSFHIGARKDELTNHNIQLSFTPQRQDSPKDWQSWLFYPKQTHRMAVSIRSGCDTQHTLRWFRSTPSLNYQEIKLPLPESAGRPE